MYFRVLDKNNLKKSLVSKSERKGTLYFNGFNFEHEVFCQNKI